MPIDKRIQRSYDPGFDDDDSANDRRRIEVTQLGTVTGSHTRLIFSAPSEVEILEIALVSRRAVSASGSAKYEFQVRNKTKGNVDLLSTAKSTATAAIVADTRYDLSPNQFLFLTSDDVLELAITKTGSPSNLDDLICQVEYQISGVTTTTSSSTTTTSSSTTTTSSSTSTTTTTTVSTTTTVT